jgi:hypothetical protein
MGSGLRAFVLGMLTLLGAVIAGCGGGGGGGGNGNDNGNGGGGGGGAGLVVGRVSGADGQPVANAAVTLSVGRSSTTDENGFFSFEDFDPGEVVVARFNASGFADTAKSVLAVPRDTATPVCVFMAEAAPSAMINADAGATQRSGNSAVTFEGGALVGENGQAVSGMVELTATYIDPSGESVMTFPGSFQDAMTESGQNVILESYGFAVYELNQNGQEVNLAPGQTATIEYVLPENDQSRFTAGDTIALWEFDEDTAMWMQAGQGEIRAASDGSGRLAWFAEVSHFSAWNCDAPIAERHAISGRVIFEGGPISGAEVTAVGESYNGTTTTRTAADGTFCLDVKRGSTVRLEVRVNGAATPLASQVVTVPDVSNPCPDPGVDVGDIAVDFDACVSGRVTNEDGSPAAGVRVYIVPGETVTTASDGSYCGAAASGMDVAIFAEGRPSVSVRTSASGTCGGSCAEANLTFTLPEAGDVVGTLFASADRSFNPDFGNFEYFTLSASFLIYDSQAGMGEQTISRPGFESRTQQIGDCSVTTATITIDSTDEDPSTFGSFGSFGALDPGDPGAASTGSVSVALRRGNPNEFDPPQPFLAGVFFPEETPDQLLDLGFGAGQTVRFNFPGGADIGAFDASIQLPDGINVTSPDLAAEDFVINPRAALPLTWDAGRAGDVIVVTIVGSRFEFDETSTSTMSTTIRCEFPDTGSATVPAAAMALLPDDSTSTTLIIARSRLDQVNVPLNRVFGSGIVLLYGQVSVSRSTFEIPDLPSACDFVNCPEGQTCNELTGLCEGSGGGSGPCDGVICPIGEFCDMDTGECGPLDFCDFIPCPEGTVCNPDTLACE